MRKLRVIYPPFVAAFPVLAVFSANLSLLPLHDLWRPLGIAVAVAITFWIAASLIARNVERGAAAATALIIACFLYGKLDDYCFVHTLPTMRIWAAASLVLAVLAGWKWRWHRALNVLSVFLVLSSVGSIALRYVKIARDEARLAPQVAPGSTSSATRPDIYYLILDGYGRSNQLKRVMGFDNGAFLTELEQRGFYVAQESHSNYVQTELSLASSLNFEFIPRLLPQQAKDSNDRLPLDNLSSHNAVAKYLRSIGYEYIAITTGFPALQFEGADLHLGRAHRISLLESALMAMTPIAQSDSATESAYVDRRQLLIAAFENIRMEANASNVKPRFIFAHILAPHPPFVFNADGSPRPKPHGGFGYWDGSDFYASGNTKDDYRNGYVGQTEYIDTQTLATLDAILSKPGPKPIILIQGDHGSKLGLSQNSLAKTDIPECMSNLMAYEVPDEVRTKLYPTITPVNSFRILLSTLFGADLPNQPDRSWYSTFDEPYNFVEVTDRLKANAPNNLVASERSSAAGGSLPKTDRGRAPQ